MKKDIIKIKIGSTKNPDVGNSSISCKIPTYKKYLRKLPTLHKNPYLPREEEFKIIKSKTL